MKEKKSEDMELLVNALLTLETKEECVAFLEDVMTIKETEAISQRLRVAQMLSEQVVYNRIVESTGASTATITRVNRCLQYGAGGYRTVLDRLETGKKEGN